MTNSATNKFIRVVVFIGMLTSLAVAPAIARDGENVRPGQTGPASTDCKLHKKLERSETKVTAFQFEYRSLDKDLKKATKGSKEAAKLQKRIDKVGKKLSRERTRAADYFVQIKERLFSGIAC